MRVSLKNPQDYFKKEQVKVLMEFLYDLQHEIPLSKDISLTFQSNDSEVEMTTGVRFPNGNIHVMAKNRMLIDIMRTIAHEWVHEYQHQKMGLKDTDPVQDVGGPEENMANVLSGIFVKKFVKTNPQTKSVVYGME